MDILVPTKRTHFLTSKYTKMVMRPGLGPGPTGLPTFPDLLAGLDGHFLAERAREDMEREEREGKGKL